MSNNPRRTVALNRSTKSNDAISKSISQTALDNMESTPSKDNFSHDPFVSISRAIHTAKIRAGTQLRTLSTSSKYQRPRPTFFQTVTNRTTRTILITIASIALLSILSQRPSSNDDNLPLWHELRVSTSLDSPSLQQDFRHRRPSTTSRNFATGPWVIALIADLDRESCHTQTRDEALRQVPCANANTWVSYLKRGILKMPSLYSDRDALEVNWLDELMLESRGHVEMEGGDHTVVGGRGMELSELEWFHGHLLTPDDHTGSLLEIMSPIGGLENASEAIYGEPSNVLPSTFRRAALHNGDGQDLESAFKSEWMAVKGAELYVGGHGKAFTDPRDGTVVKNNDAKWVKVIDKTFEVSHVNWTKQYDAVANAVGISFPGYLMHEAVLHSTERSEWVFLPRRKSPEPFEPKENERKGSNTVIIANEDFSIVKSVEITGLSDSSGLRGFSSAKFVRGSADRLIAALRTTEVDPVDAEDVRVTETYFSIFEIPSGKVVYEEEKVSNRKYEGLVFL